MADSIRLKVLKNIKTTLLGVTTANGFNNDLTNVSLFRMLGNSKASLPCAVITADLETREEGMSQLVHTDFAVYVTLYHAQEESSSVETDEFIDSLYQDIVKALLTDRERGGNAIDTEIQEIMNFDLEDGQHFYGMSFKLLIKFRTQPDDVTVVR